MIVTQYAERTQTWVTPAGHAAIFTYREDTNDWNTISSCLTDDEYRLPRGLSGLALDIGAYIGPVTVALALDNPGLRVIAVEPVPDNVRLLRRNRAVNGLGDRVKVIEGAVGSGKTISVQFNFRGSPIAEHHAFVGNSSLFATEYTATYDTIEAPAWTLEELAQEPIAWCKIDTEGAEYDILASPAVVLCQIIAGEWHNTGGHTRGDILALLSPTHEVTFSGPISGPGGFRAVRR